MKICTKCKQLTLLSSFYADKRWGALHSECKTCFKARCAAYNKIRPEARRRAVQKCRAINPDRAKLWGRIAAAKRRVALSKATPKWANLEKIKAVYAEAIKRNMHVDHIVPIQGKIVCGLHCEQNLQLLSMRDNSVKSNCYWPDMPTGI